MTSDNGGTSEFGPFASLGPFRSKKGSIYEGGLRVPMLARWPGKIQAGSVSDLPWSFQDVYATLAELAESRGLPPNVDGRSIAPTLLGKAQDRERPLYWEQITGRKLLQAVRMGDWKGVRQGAISPLELYNLKDDIGEKRNVAANHPQIVLKMEEFLAGCRTESPDYAL